MSGRMGDRKTSGSCTVSAEPCTATVGRAAGMLLVNPGVETRSGLLEEGEPSHHLRLLQSAFPTANSATKIGENKRRTSPDDCRSVSSNHELVKCVHFLYASPVATGRNGELPRPHSPTRLALSSLPPRHLDPHAPASKWTSTPSSRRATRTRSRRPPTARPSGSPTAPPASAPGATCSRPPCSAAERSRRCDRR